MQRMQKAQQVLSQTQLSLSGERGGGIHNSPRVFWQLQVITWGPRGSNAKYQWNHLKSLRLNAVLADSLNN
jgi:hypothetical protein